MSTNISNTSTSSTTSTVIKYPGCWRNKNHYRAFVYRPYYFSNYNTPYFTSRYISNNDKIYDPILRHIRQINLKDGTMIEGFSENNSWVILFILLTGLLCFAYKKI